MNTDWIWNFFLKKSGIKVGRVKGMRIVLTSLTLSSKVGICKGFTEDDTESPVAEYDTLVRMSEAVLQIDEKSRFVLMPRFQVVMHFRFLDAEMEQE